MSTDDSKLSAIVRDNLEQCLDSIEQMTGRTYELIWQLTERFGRFKVVMQEYYSATYSKTDHSLVSSKLTPAKLRSLDGVYASIEDIQRAVASIDRSLYIYRNRIQSGRQINTIYGEIQVVSRSTPLTQR